VLRDEYLLTVLKTETALSEWAFFTVFNCLFVKEIKNEVFACFSEITNCEIPSSNPLHRDCSGFLIAACVYKSCSETRL